MEVKREDVEGDLEKLLSMFHSKGQGTEKDRMAHFLLQSFGVLGRRLDDKTAIKLMYVDKQNGGFAPTYICEVATSYFFGDIDEEETKKRLSEGEVQCKAIFSEMGISPKIMTHVGPKGGPMGQVYRN